MVKELQVLVERQTKKNQKKKEKKVLSVGDLENFNLNWFLGWGREKSEVREDDF